MNTQQENQTVENLISSYAEALKAADAGAIATFYIEDGQLMPAGFKTISAVQIPKIAEHFFSKTNFSINFTVKDVVVENSLAYVFAEATATSVDQKTNQKTTKVSRDSFVLRKDQNQWKIFRYIFNSSDL